MNPRNLLRPSAYANKVMRWFAQAMRRHLATTPLIWGEPSRVQIGKNVKLVDVIINCRSGKVTIGDDAFFGHGAMLLTGTHDMRKRNEGRHAAVPQSGRDITVGKGAWIASNVIVIGPCEIGDNAVVGSGSVVSGKVEAGALYAGNPAELVRRIEFENGADP